jgi:DNA-binding MarR family transcriptional regulator
VKQSERRQEVAEIALALRGFSITADELLARHVPVEFTSNSSILTLGVLARAKRLRPRDVLHDVPITSGGLSKLLDRLVSLGLVERVPPRGDDDGRAVEVRLTPAGRRTHRRLLDSIDQALQVEATRLKEIVAACERLDPRGTSVEPVVDGLDTALGRLGLELDAALRQSPEVPRPVELAAAIALATIRLEGPCRPRRIAETVGLTSGGTTKLLDRMAEQGLIVRSDAPVDGDHRAVSVDATAAGDGFLDAVLDAWDRRIERIHDVIRPLAIRLGQL